MNVRNHTNHSEESNTKVSTYNNKTLSPVYDADAEQALRIAHWTIRAATKCSQVIIA